MKAETVTNPKNDDVHEMSILNVTGYSAKIPSHYFHFSTYIELCKKFSNSNNLIDVRQV